MFPLLILVTWLIMPACYSSVVATPATSLVTWLQMEATANSWQRTDRGAEQRWRSANTIEYEEIKKVVVKLDLDPQIFKLFNNTYDLKPKSSRIINYLLLNLVEYVP
jgi:hypothetical protein